MMRPCELRVSRCPAPWLITLAFLAAVAQGADRYVAHNGQIPAYPYTNWVMAASNIQDAVTAADRAAQVVVGPGRYTLSPNPTNYAGSNVVFINRSLTLCSSNRNPETTIIDGEGANRGIAVVCGTAGEEIVIDGFTITNCHAVTMGGGILLTDPTSSYLAAGWTGRVQNCRLLNNKVTYGPGIAFVSSGAYGGGVGMYARSASGLLVSNCVLQANVATNEMAASTYGGEGGAIYCVTYGGLTGVMYSRIRNNMAYRGGNVTVWALGGGGASFDSCEISGGKVENGIMSYGGGVFLSCSAMFRNCLLYGNNTGPGGRGSAIHEEAQGSNLVLAIENCTLAGNVSGGSAIFIRRWKAAQAFMPSLHLVNSIVYSNSADLFLLDTFGTYHDIPANYSSYASNLCIGSTNSGVTDGTTNLLYFQGYSSGTFTNNPMFMSCADQDFRLNSNSPCVNTGTNQWWMDGSADLDGNPRIVQTNVDMGTYEYPSYTTSGIRRAWLRQFGLATDGSADYSHDDPDGMNNLEEYLAGTDPTDPNSFLGIMAISNLPPLGMTGFIIQWASVTGKHYRLDRSTNLLANPSFAFSMRTNIPGTPPLNGETDTNATGKGPYFYRIGLE